MDFMKITDVASMSSDLSMAQLWTLMQWRRVIDKALTGSISKHNGQDVAVRVQNQAIEIFTTNLFRLRAPSDKVLEGIVHSLLPDPVLPIDYWFTRDAREQPSGWPVEAPRIGGAGVMPRKARNRPTDAPRPFGRVSTRGFKNKDWANLDQHPALKGVK